MAKKGDLAGLLRGFSSSGRIDRHGMSEPDHAGDAAEAVAPRVEKEPGIFDPIMAQLSSEEKFQFLSGLMDFMGDFIVNMLNQYTFELGKVENSISNMQSTVLNQVRTIRNQVDIARQQGHFKAPEGPPTPLGISGILTGNVIAAASSAVGSSDETEEEREATERDVMDIAASIRTLITRQKMAKPVATQPATEEVEAKVEPIKEAAGKASLDTKLQQFQKSADEQKQRIDRIASTAKPAAAPAAPVAVQPTVKPPAHIKHVKPASGKKQGKAMVTPTAKPASQPVAKPTMIDATKPTAVKLDKEKNMLPKGFQQELMKNIKGLIKDKGKEKKKLNAD